MLTLADVLFVPATAPLVFKLGANLLLVLHIGGGVVGVISGVGALVFRKGGRLHRLAGDVFFVAMLAMSGIGATVAPFLPDWGSAMGGLFTFYLVTTGWLAARRAPGRIGRLEIALMALPLTAAALQLTFAWLASRDPRGLFEGLPIYPMLIIASLSFAAVVADVTVIRRGGLIGGQRLARHLWRLCVGLLVAVGSAETQPKIVPPSMRGDWLFLPIVAIVAVMVFWLVRVLWPRRRPRPLLGAELPFAAG